MKIYTKKGDTGETSLFGGQRVSKSNERVLAYGDVDEANSFIGVAASSQSLPKELKERLNAVMSDLFDLGAELATPPSHKQKHHSHNETQHPHNLKPPSHNKKHHSHNETQHPHN